MMIVEITPIGEIKPKIRADKNPVNEMALIDDERELPRQLPKNLERIIEIGFETKVIPNRARYESMKEIDEKSEGKIII